MASFAYRARTKAGAQVQGIIEAASQQEAVSKLDRMGLFPVSLNEVCLPDASGMRAQDSADAPPSSQARLAPSHSSLSGAGPKRARLLLAAVFIAAPALAAVLMVLKGNLEGAALKRQHLAELHRLEVANAKEAEDDLARHRLMLADLNLIAGAVAEAAHETEWARRCQHEPAAASTPREKAILKQSAASHDGSFSVEKVLSQVVRQVAPRKSTVEVTRGLRGSLIDVTLDFAPQGRGATIEGLKQIAAKETTDVVLSVYRHCGPKGVERVAVSCRTDVWPWWGAGPGLFSQQNPEKKVIYRVAMEEQDARTVADWWRATSEQAAGLLKVRLDDFQGLEIRKGLAPRFGPP